MPWDSKHTEWLLDTGKTILTEEGIQVKVFEYQHQNDDDILSSWARHFRNHYCLDTEIDDYREGYGCTREEFLKLIKFPDRKKVPGPSIRSGDFGELLVADYLEYLCGYVVPRTRYGDKNIRNESTKGSDIIGFKILSGDEWSENDELAIFEAKAQFSGDKPNPRLQDAVDDSANSGTHPPGRGLSVPHPGPLPLRRGGWVRGRDYQRGRGRHSGRRGHCFQISIFFT